MNTRRFLNKLLPMGLSRKAPAKSAKKRPRTQLGLESLETRLVLSHTLLDGTHLTITGTDNDDVIELVSPTANSMQVFFNGVKEFDGSNVIDRIDLDAGAGSADQVLIRGVQSNVTGRLNVGNAEKVTLGKPDRINRFSLASIQSQVQVNMPRDGSLFVLNDGDASDHTVTVAADRVQGLAPHSIFYTFANRGLSHLDLTTGNGKDTINIHGTPEVGAFGVNIITNGGDDTFNIDSNTSVLHLGGGDGNDTFNTTPISRNMSTLDRRVEINGGAGTNILVANDQNRDLTQYQYTATLSMEALSSDIVISTLDISALNLQSGQTDRTVVKYRDVQTARFKAPTDGGDSGILVLSTAAGVNTVIDSGGARQVHVGDADLLNGIQGELTIKRVTAGGLVFLHDSAQTTAQVYTFRANSDEHTSSVERAGMAKVTFEDSIDQVQVFAGHKDDTFDVVALRGGTGTYLLDGGSGNNNELISPDTDNEWQVTDFNAGQLNSRVHFQKVEDLQGGIRDDHFKLSNGVGVLGFIHGHNGADGGFDTIDYSLYTTSVGVNLAEQRGRNVDFGTAGHLTGIDAIFGSQAGDTLTGDGGDNVILGLGGNDVIVGGGGKDILIGGSGVDDISNDNSETIFVAGRTADGSISFGRTASITNPDDMKALHDEWTRTDATYQQRVDHILGGGGLNGSVKLNSTTIRNDNAADIIHPGTAPDLIFIHSDDLLSANPLPTAEEIVNL